VSIPFNVASAQSASIVFNAPGGDNFGLLLDNVRLTLVPAPASAAMLGAFAAFASRRRAR
jgi:hypothetical protein